MCFDYRHPEDKILHKNVIRWITGGVKERKGGLGDSKKETKREVTILFYYFLCVFMYLCVCVCVWFGLANLLHFNRNLKLHNSVFLLFLNIKASASYSQQSRRGEEAKCHWTDQWINTHTTTTTTGILFSLRKKEILQLATTSMTLRALC